MKRLERKWMYERLDDTKKVRLQFVNGVEEFIKHATKQEDFHQTNKIRCPCEKCENTKYLNEVAMREHLYLKGFCKNYYDWIAHGEEIPINQTELNVSNNTYRNMVIDALGSSTYEILEEPPLEKDDRPNREAMIFFDMLNAASKPLYEGSKVSLLQAVARVTNLKCEYNLAHKCVDSITSLIEDIIPAENIATTSFYTTKKVLKGLELPHKKIHACPEGCMLFWKDDALQDKCKKCGRERYKKSSSGKLIGQKVLTYLPIGPRLQRLYATKNIANEMRWHSANPRAHETMAHPSDGEAWNFFDTTYPQFACEPRNVRLGLCTDGFSPFGQYGKSYSCWPVMLTPYNLPPWLCMKKQFIFLALIIPGPKNPKKYLDVYLQPLIDELKELWETGIETYDVSTKQNFFLKAALMWTINDFPAYGMLSGWSTAGLKACPYCMERTKSFYLPNGRKECWFDCHRQFLQTNHVFRKNKSAFYKNREETDIGIERLVGQEIWERVSDYPNVIDGSDEELKKLKLKKTGWFKQSIFWNLPYWKSLLIRHNLDVMHIENFFFEQLIHMIMDVKDKTCDNSRTRKDLPKFCKRRTLHVNERGEMPKASFVLNHVENKVLCEWVSNLKFPDGYASDLSRCVDTHNRKLHGLKSHDCHVFMERLLPVALKRLLPTNVWNAITEISQFFRDLCASTIKVDDMIRLQNNIPEIICKLEKHFPPAFFNSMEHLPIHLPYEAKVGGPVQYRWMYPFERYLNHLKKKIGNKARVEGSICNAYLTEEISTFCSFYFEDHIDTKVRNLDVGSKEPVDSSLPEFFRPHEGGYSKNGRVRYLTNKEYERAHIYVLSNCGVLREYEQKFEMFIIQQYPTIRLDDVWSQYEEQFPQWFKEQVIESNNKDDLLRALAMGPSKEVTCWNRFFINGYNFHTFDYGKHKRTMNYGVCVSSPEEQDYYGIIDDIIELSYYGYERCYKAVLFKCNWMDNSANGVNIHEIYKLVEVNHTRKYPKYDPFILAHQAQQVYYASYPSTKSDRNQWWAVFKAKPRSQVDAPIDKIVFQEDIGSEPPLLSNIEDDELDEDEYEDEEYNEDNDVLVSLEEDEEECEEEWVDDDDGDDSNDDDNDNIAEEEEEDDGDNDDHTEEEYSDN